MKIINVKDLKSNTDTFIHLEKKEDFLMMAGEGRIDEDGDALECYIFYDIYEESYFALAEGITYIYTGEL